MLVHGYILFLKLRHMCVELVKIDPKCSDLGWVCIPLVVESYGAWGKEALEAFSMLASRLATSSSSPNLWFCLNCMAGSISI